MQESYLPSISIPKRANTMDMKRTSIELCVYHINNSITAELVWVEEEEIQFETNNSSKLASRVAELGSLSSGAKMAMKIFVKRVSTGWFF